ncbi:MAG: D-alanyl-D-alanine carboxypeptidase [Verrucomicrobiaceae bacterium]|nr:D-alanyl-D-alanine carboxypeptidase [Verrucomicrobiaceae bacterium]
MQTRPFSKSLRRLAVAVVTATSLVACAAKPSRPVGGATQFAPQEPLYPPSSASYPVPVAQPVVPSYQQSAPAQPAAASRPAPVQNALLTPAVSGEPMYAASKAPAINAASYILLDAKTGSTIVSHNADSTRPVASTQKLLTALVILDAGNLDKPVRIAASDVQVEPTRLGVRPGEVYTRRKLLYAFLVKSANDVANVLARDNAGSIGAFAAKMNAKARTLGATHSSFRNPHGLPASGQYSTARDMARIAIAAYRNPIIRDIVRQPYHSFRYASGRTVTLENTNKLLGQMAECNGMKTGYTNAAGRCLISSATTRGRAVILVQLGTKTKYIWNDAHVLMDWGLARAR